MKIAIIGAGITGLSCAYRLLKEGTSVDIYEAAAKPGGLGTYVQIGDWAIERFYHHFFETDKHVLGLINELGLQDQIHFYPSKTAIFINNKVYPFSVPLDILKFFPLPFLDRIRSGLALGYLKYLPTNDRKLDQITAIEWIKKYGGENVFKTIWEPLIVGKFDKFASSIPALWLKERIRDRSFRLGYLDGGSKTLFEALMGNIENLGGQVYLSTPVSQIYAKGKKVIVTDRSSSKLYDKCLITAVSPIAQKLVKNKLTQSLKETLGRQDQLGAVCLLLELKKPIQSHYWTNICDRNEKVLVMVEHTNLLNSKHYNNRSLVYLANYIHRDDRRYALSDEEIITDYTQILSRLNPSFNKNWILKTHVSRIPRAQTIFYQNSLRTRPPHAIIKDRIFLGNIDQMYPHDRNFNLGVELGKQLANVIMNKVV